MKASRLLLSTVTFFVLFFSLFSPGKAAVIYSGRLYINGPNLNIDINNDGKIDFSTEWRIWILGDDYSLSGFDIINFRIGCIYAGLPGHEYFPGTIAPIDFGTVIGDIPPDNLKWSYNSNDAMIWCIIDDLEIYYSGIWNNIKGKFIGFELLINSQSFYGWIQINTDASGNVVLVDYAYEDIPFLSIAAGDGRTTIPVPGDINSDEIVDMEDLISCQKIVSGSIISSHVSTLGDINGDNKIGLEELIYILNVLSGIE